MRPSFDDGAAPEFRETQYFEMFVNRGIYHQGWTAVTRHSTPWVMAPLPAIDEDIWELYGPDDWTQAHDLAAEEPERLAHLQRLFLIEAAKNNVLPLDDRRVERFNPEIAGRPSLIRGNTQLLFGGMGRLSENSVLNIKNRSHAVTAQVVVPEDTVANGVLISQGGAFGGWAIYVERWPPGLLLQPLRPRSASRSMATPPSRQASTRSGWSSRTTAAVSAKGGAVTLYLDGAAVGQGRVEITEPMAFSGDETTDVGFDSATPVSDDYGPQDSRFNGRVRVGPDRPGRGRRGRRPPDHPRGALPGRHGPQ